MTRRQPEHLVRFVQDFRTRAEKAWGPDTRTPTPSGVVGAAPSWGQCAPTSIALFEELQTRQYPARVDLVSGKVCTLDSQGVLRTGIEHHNWVAVQFPVDLQPFILDVTCDQCESIDRNVIAGWHDDIESKLRIVYVPFRSFNLPSEIMEGPWFEIEQRPASRFLKFVARLPGPDVKLLDEHGRVLPDDMLPSSDESAYAT